MQPGCMHGRVDRIPIFIFRDGCRDNRQATIRVFSFGALAIFVALMFLFCSSVLLIISAVHVHWKINVQVLLST